MLSESDKKRIEVIGPNYMKPNEIAYYKKQAQTKKERKKPSKTIRSLEPPAVYRANCPNIACLSSVDTEDTLQQELRFSCLECGCSWTMNRNFAYRLSDF